MIVSFWATVAVFGTLQAPAPSPSAADPSAARCSAYAGGGSAQEAQAALSACDQALAGRVDPRLTYHKGRALFDLERDAEALAAYRAAAQGGIAPAITQLAVMHHWGYGVGEDLRKAQELYKQALEAGDAAAALGLGRMLTDGGAVPKDLVAAAGYWRRAADAGLAGGQLELGYAYEFGLGVPANLARAAELYGSAAKQGNRDAQFNLGLLYEKGRGLEQDLQEALRLYHLAAGNGSPNAMHALGGAHAAGRGTRKDLAEAERWYRRGIAAGDEVDSPNSLAYLFAVQGRNIDEASSLAEKALKAAPENPAIMDTLGFIRFQQKRLPEAAALLEAAAKLKPASALYHARLGDIYAALGRRADAVASWRRGLAALARSTGDQEISVEELRRRLRR